MLKEIRTLFLQVAGLDQYDTDYSALTNVKKISNSERKAAEIIIKYPHLKETDIIKDLEQGWMRITN